MPDLSPFRGIRYDLDAIDDLAAVVSPPYDVISPAARDRLEAASPHNVVRLILGREEPDDHEGANKYTRARSLLDAWLAAGVLRPDAAPAFYLYEISGAFEGRAHAMRGLLAAVDLSEPAHGGVLPHERTYAQIVGDRLELLRATETNLEPVFLVYEGSQSPGRDAIDAAAAGEPIAEASTDDGVRHVLWRIAEPDAVAAIAADLRTRSIVIADGHHRWRTAQTYRAERREALGEGPWDRHLAFVVDVAHSGPLLLPIHRVLAGPSAADAIDAMSDAFAAEPFAGDPDALAAEVAARASAGGRWFGVFDARTSWLVSVADPEAERAAMPPDRSANWRDLDVAVLHEWVFGRLLGGAVPTFVHSPDEAAEAIVDGPATVGFLLAPTPFAAVRAVAEEGEAMPQKSTYFVPKPRTGLVMRGLDG